MAWTQADLDALNESIADGALVVSYQDKTTRYRSLDEMLRLREMMQGEIKKTAGQVKTTRRRFSIRGRGF